MVHGGKDGGRYTYWIIPRFAPLALSAPRRWPSIFMGARQRAASARSARAGRKITVIVLPDADIESATQIITDSAFGCAGQRCLAVSVAVTIADAQKSFRDSISNAASNLRVGYGLDQGVQMGPVITPQSKTRVEELIGLGQKRRREGPGGWA